MYYEKYLKNNQLFQNKRFQSTTIQQYNPHSIPSLERTPPHNKSQLNLKYSQTYNVTPNTQRKSEDLQTQQKAIISFHQNKQQNNDYNQTQNFTAQFNQNSYGNNANQLNPNPIKSTYHQDNYNNSVLSRKKDFIKPKQEQFLNVKQNPSSYPSLSYFDKSSINPQNHLRSTFGESGGYKYENDNLMKNEKKNSYYQGSQRCSIDDRQPHNVQNDMLLYNNNYEGKKEQLKNDYYSFSPLTSKQQQKQKDFYILPKNVNKNSQPNLNEKQNYFISKNIFKSPSDNNLFLRKSNSIKQETKDVGEVIPQKFPVSNKNIINQVTMDNQETQQNSKNNYHALFENLEKKFSEQKKSYENYEVKQKGYMNQLAKKDEKIKRLQTIIENNKQTMMILEDTIKQMHKKIQTQSNQAALDNPVILVLEIDNLKKQNIKIKDENRKSKNQYAFLQEQYISLQEQVNKFKNNQKKLKESQIRTQQQFQEQILQLSRVKELHSSLNLQNCKLIKQSQTLNQQNQDLKRNQRILNVNIQSLNEKIQNLSKNSENERNQKNILSKQIETLRGQLQMLKKEHQQKIDNLNIKNQKKQFQVISEVKTEYQLLKSRQLVEALKSQNQKMKMQIQNISRLLSAYHCKYIQFALGLNLDFDKNELKESKDNPNENCLEILSILIQNEIEKNTKDVKKFTLLIKQSQNQSQQKNQKLYELDKTLKKQAAKINSLLVQNQQKNFAIWDLNKMQLQSQVSKLNQKYEILNVNILGIYQN